MLIIGLSLFMSSFALADERVSPAPLAEVVSQRTDQLAPIESDEQAVRVFATTIGPALGLKDPAGALAAKRLPSHMVKELGLPELSQSVSELMAALAAWQLSDTISHDASHASATTVLSVARQDWLRHRSGSLSLSDMLSLLQEDHTLRTSRTDPKRPTPNLSLVAQRTMFEASQRATTAWWEVYGWRERVRQARGRARLCGTWQWIVHNHQNHGEQKAPLVFPPDGKGTANSPTPVETIILGDSIYLRWEQNGHIQEDSLLFVKDDKIEGSFMNNTGGFGPISGKRTAPCRP